MHQNGPSVSEVRLAYFQYIYRTTICQLMFLPKQQGQQIPSPSAAAHLRGEDMPGGAAYRGSPDPQTRRQQKL
jgi:hypothetical protein